MATPRDTIPAGEVRPEGAQDREEALRLAWEAVERVRAHNADKDPDEILAEVTAEVEAVRQEMYERRKAAENGR